MFKIYIILLLLNSILVIIIIVIQSRRKYSGKMKLHQEKIFKNENILQKIFCGKAGVETQVQGE